jgi:hypothetical protein
VQALNAPAYGRAQFNKNFEHFPGEFFTSDVPASPIVKSRCALSDFTTSPACKEGYGNLIIAV